MISIQNVKLEDGKTGITKILKNARDLLWEAQLLFENNRFSRSYTLAQFSIEELGKAHMLFDALISQDDPKCNIILDKFNKSFYSHQAKTTESAFIELGINSEKCYELKNEEEKHRMIKEFLNELNISRNYDQLKNLSLYTELKGNKFFGPEENISYELAIGRIEIAKRRNKWSNDNLVKWIENL